MNTSSTGSSSNTREFASAKILTQEEQKIMLGTCLDNVRKTTPLVHNITNYVTVNDVANILLACGASPIMSDEPEDVEDITSLCGGLNINIGTLHRTSIDGMYRAGAKAASLGHKILLDPVGAGASHLRTSTAVGLMEKIPFTVIRGNISEIKTLALGSGTTKGVDADVADKVTDENLDSAVAFAKNFAKDHNCVVAITGAIDLVADADTCYVIRNGRAEMGSITGTGCQLSGMMTAYLVATPPTATASSTPSTTWTARRWRKVQSMKCDKKGLLLYAVTDRSWLNGETLYSQVEKALQGGATFIQLREKNLDQDHFMEEALELKKLCAAYHVPFVINDNVEIAAKMDADGVHVGQSDMEAGDVRAKLGPDKIIGVSAQTVEQAILAEQRGADYLGVGAVFHTGSKADAEDVSHETLTAICNAVNIPVIAIGGITRDNVTELSGSGICGIAVISAIFAQKDIVSATKDLKEQTLRMLENK